MVRSFQERNGGVMKNGMVDKYGYLIPADGARSFYKKARVLSFKNETGYILVSYCTPVAVYKDGVLHKTWAGWSATTARHIKSFCIHLGVGYPNKKAWENLPYEDRYTLTV